IRKEGISIMIQNIEYLVTLHRPDGGLGKIMLVHSNQAFEVQWSIDCEEEEEVHIYYVGPHLEQAWEAVETLLLERLEEGYHVQPPLIDALLKTLSPRYVFTRKLECFSSQHHNLALFQELKQWRRLK